MAREKQQDEPAEDNQENWKASTNGIGSSSNIVPTTTPFIHPPCQSPAPLWKSLRLKVIVLCCTIMCFSFASQASMTSAMVCMIRDDDVNGTDSNQSLTNGVYRSSQSEEDAWQVSWDSETQGWVVSAFFVGYYVMQMPSGVLVTRLGPKRILVLGLVLAGILHLLTIPAVLWSMPLLLVIRVMAGLACGCLLTGTYAIVANWCPSQESSLLYGIAGIGIEFGNMSAFLLSLVGCEWDFQGGWPIVFYALGGIMILQAMVMGVVITDFPYNNRLIHPQETTYIMNNRAHSDKAKHIPYRRILTSPPVWAFLAAEFGIEWMYYTIVTQGPRFLKEVVKLSSWQINLLGSVPFLSSIPTMLLLGYVCDKALQKNVLSTTMVRKCNEVFVTALTVTPFLLLGFVQRGEFGHASLVYVTVAAGIAGTYAGYMANPGDLSPAHSGFLVGLGQTLTMWVAFVIPAFSGYITKQKDRRSWQTVFYIVVGVEVFCCTIYCLMGSGKLQAWAVDEPTEETPIIGRDNKNHKSHSSSLSS